MQDKYFTKKELILGVITGVLSTLIIMWFIEPFSKWLIPKFVYLFDTFSLSYSNALYEDVANITAGTIGAYNVTLSVLLWYAILLFLSASVHRIQKKYNKIVNKAIEKLDPSPEKDSKPDEPEKEITAKSLRKEKTFLNRLFKLIYVLAATSLFLIFYSGIRQIYVYEISSHATRNIEIVSPYISDQEYKQLKSAFYTIDSKADYDSFVDQINLIAEANSLILKE